MRYYKGLGVGHIYTSLRPDDGILLSEDATTTHPTHHLEVGDEEDPHIITGPDPLPDNEPRDEILQINIDGLHAASSAVHGPTINEDPGDGNSEGSESDDSHEEKDDEPLPEENLDDPEDSDDDVDIELDDMYQYDPLDLDYED